MTLIKEEQLEWMDKEHEHIIDLRGPRFHVTQKGSTKKRISK